MGEAHSLIKVLNSPINEYIPVRLTEKQRAFFDSNEDEVLYGGAAGGGKTVALLATAARFVDHPNYSAVIFRRTFPQLEQPHGILDLAHSWWLKMPGVKWVASTKTYHFPSGAQIKFSHLKDEGDKYNHQGAEYHATLWDELTQFTKTQFSYLKTRRRKNHGDPIPLITRSTTNPGGTGHKWVKGRYIKKPLKGRIFMPATMVDNPYLDRDAYAASFEGLDSTTVDQLRFGKWIDNSGGLVYPIPESSIVDHFIPGKDSHYLIAVDLGTSESVPSTAFVVGVWDENVPHCVWIVYAKKIAGLTTTSTADHLKLLQRVYPAERIIVDPGGLGGGYIKEFRDRHGLPAFAAEKREKLANRRLLRGALEEGKVLFFRSPCSDLLEECETLQWNDAGTDVEKGAVDHLADALLYLYRGAKAWMSSEKAPPPLQGSREWYAEQEREMLEAELAQHRSQVLGNGYGY